MQKKTALESPKMQEMTDKIFKKIGNRQACPYYLKKFSRQTACALAEDVSALNLQWKKEQL